MPRTTRCATATASTPVDVGVGGSIPFIADLVREFPGAQILVTGVEDPHSRAHSPNESLHLDTFRHAVLTEALLLAAPQRANRAIESRSRRAHGRIGSTAAPWPGHRGES